MTSIKMVSTTLFAFIIIFIRYVPPVEMNVNVICEKVSRISYNNI